MKRADVVLGMMEAKRAALPYRIGGFAQMTGPVSKIKGCRKFAQPCTVGSGLQRHVVVIGNLDVLYRIRKHSQDACRKRNLSILLIPGLSG
jgi:hypothetical protein